MKEIYLDNSATTQLDKNVLAEMLPYLTEQYGNASSIYKLGRLSKKAVEDSREKIASIFNCEPEEIYFTSGGSESDNTIIKGIAHKYHSQGNHIITTKIEHPAVLETCKQLEAEGYDITYLDVDSKGQINLTELENSIKDTTILITIMYANNEIGTIEPIDEIGKIAKKHNVFFHTDAVQAAGIENIDVQEMNIDSISISSHKFYGPKGIGALYVRKTIKFIPLISGGHQERNKRAGTENVAGIVGMAYALDLAHKEIEKNQNQISTLRDYYEKEIFKNLSDLQINGDINNRLPGNSNISFFGINGDSLLLNLDNAGIYASLGSACTSGSIEPSHVLTAIGVPIDKARGSLRISIGKYNTKEDIDYLVKILTETVLQLRNIK